MAGKLWKLKCVYGLVDAARHWYEKVKSVLVDLGCSYSPLDPCVFYLKSNSKLHGILSSHVDDFWWCGDSHFEAVVVRGVFERFDVKSSVKVPFKYLGFDVFMKKGVLVVDQSAYAKEILVLQPPFKDGPIDATLISNTRKLLGKLQWLATQTRPDICFDVNALLSRSKVWEKTDITLANKIVRKIQFSTDLCSQEFKTLGRSQEWRLEAFSDASLANVPSGRTQAGYDFFERYRDETAVIDVEISPSSKSGKKYTECRNNFLCILR